MQKGQGGCKETARVGQFQDACSTVNHQGQERRKDDLDKEHSKRFMTDEPIDPGTKKGKQRRPLGKMGSFIDKALISLAGEQAFGQVFVFKGFRIEPKVC